MVKDQLQYGYARANIGVASSFVTCATVAVAFRFHARRISGVYYSWDDYTIVVALILCLGLCIMAAWAAVDGGLGVPKEALDEATTILYLKQTWVQEMLFTPAIGTIKVSVCLFYRRVFFVNRIFRLCTHVMIAISVCWTIAYTLCVLLTCVPISLQWSLSSHIKRTLNFANLIISMAATDLFLDVVILSMPIPMIKSLKLPSKKKWMLGGMFGLGAFCVVASAVRLTFTVLLLRGYVFGAHNTFNRDENQIAIWSNIEPCASVVCACLPTYGPFLSRSRGSHPDSPLNMLRTFTSQLSAKTLLQTRNKESTAERRNSSSMRKVSDALDNTATGETVTGPADLVRLSGGPVGPKRDVEVVTWVSLQNSVSSV